MFITRLIFHIVDRYIWYHLINKDDNKECIKKNLKQYWRVPIIWKREKIREIKSLFTISSQRFYNFTPEFSPSYLFLLLSLLHMLAKCLNFDSISSGKISILSAWISWNIFFPEILRRNHFSFSRCDALSFFTTRGTKVLIVASKCVQSLILE